MEKRERESQDRCEYNHRVGKCVKLFRRKLEFNYLAAAED